MDLEEISKAECFLRFELLESTRKDNDREILIGWLRAESPGQVIVSAYCIKTNQFNKPITFL
jgi:hypothetical protein